MSEFLAAHSLEFLFESNGYRGVRATNNIERGSTIFSENAIGIVARDGNCQQCLSTSVGSACSSCKKVWYCSRSCQKLNWDSHKLICGKDYLDNDSKMLVEVSGFLNSKDSKFKLQQEGFLDLVSNIANAGPQAISKLRHSLQNARRCCENLDDSHLVHLARFNCNNFIIYDEEMNILGEGTFPFGSLINHSCEPNCVVVFQNRTLYLTAITDIEKMDELLIAYCDPIQDQMMRQRYLRDNYFFDCKCNRCILNCNLSIPDSAEQSYAFISNRISNFYFNNMDAPSQQYRIKVQKLISEIPSWYMNLEFFKDLTKQLQIHTENGNWLKASELAKLSMGMYYLTYPPYHPLICLQSFLTSKCLWNSNIGDISEALLYVEIALKIRAVVHGSRFPKLKQEMDTLHGYILNEIKFRS